MCLLSNADAGMLTQTWGIGIGGKAALPGFSRRLKIASADGPHARPEPAVVGAATKAGLPGFRMRQ